MSDCHLNNVTVSALPTNLGVWQAPPDVTMPVTVKLVETGTTDPVPVASVTATVGDDTYTGTPDGGDGWTVPVETPANPGNHLLVFSADNEPFGHATLRVSRGSTRNPSPSVTTVAVGGTVTLTFEVLSVGSGGGSSTPPVSGDGIDVQGYTVSVDATVVRDGDVRLTDARQPLPHTHPATDITGLAAVATTGSYGDLSGAPTIPSTPGDVGADPAGTAQGLVDGLADVASTGSYDDLDDRPSIPSTPGDVGADPAGAADGAVQDHVAASDPHGDRAYTDSAVAGLDAGDVGAVPEGGLPVRIVDDGATTTVTGAGTPADPLVIASHGGGGGGGGAPMSALMPGGGIAMNGTTSGTAEVSDNRLAALRSPEPITITQATVRVATASGDTGSTAALIIYRYDSTGGQWVSIIDETFGTDTDGDKALLLPEPVTIPAGWNLWGTYPVSGDNNPTRMTAVALPSSLLPIRDAGNPGGVALSPAPPASPATVSARWGVSAPRVVMEVIG